MWGNATELIERGWGTSGSREGGNTFRDETKTPSISGMGELGMDELGKNRLPTASLGRTRRMVIAVEQDLDGNQQRWRDFTGRGGKERGGRGTEGDSFHPYGR